MSFSFIDWWMIFFLQGVFRIKGEDVDKCFGCTIGKKKKVVTASCKKLNYFKFQNYKSICYNEKVFKLLGFLTLTG